MDRLNLMTSFIAVVEAGTITAAGQRLGKTKALVSTHLNQLEEYLQVRLVTRSTRSLQLTPEGQAYYEQAKQFMDDLANLEARVRQEQQSLVGRLRISAPATYGELVLMPFVATFIANNPDLDIELELSDRHVDIVGEGFDLAVRIGQLNDSSLIARPAGFIQMKLCATPEFLTRHPKLQGAEDLKRLPMVLDTNHRTLLKLMLNPQDPTSQFSPKICARVNSALASVNLACSGTAFAYVPDFAASQAVALGKLQFFMEDQCQSKVPIHLVYPHRKHLSAKVSAFISEFTSTLDPNPKCL